LAWRPVGAAGGLEPGIERVSVAVRVAVPAVPWRVTVAVPVGAVEDAVSVSVDVAAPPAGAVTGLGENAAVTPVGSPDAERVVGPPETLLTVTVAVLTWPRGRVTWGLESLPLFVAANPILPMIVPGGSVTCPDPPIATAL
jgi:hypothetical protein